MGNRGSSSGAAWEPVGDYINGIPPPLLGANVMLEGPFGGQDRGPAFHILAAEHAKILHGKNKQLAQASFRWLAAECQYDLAKACKQQPRDLLENMISCSLLDKDYVAALPKEDRIMHQTSALGFIVAMSSALPPCNVSDIVFSNNFLLPSFLVLAKDADKRVRSAAVHVIGNYARTFLGDPPQSLFDVVKGFAQDDSVFVREAVACCLPSLLRGFGDGFFKHLLQRVSVDDSPYVWMGLVETPPEDLLHVGCAEAVVSIITSKLLPNIDEEHGARGVAGAIAWLSALLRRDPRTPPVEALLAVCSVTDAAAVEQLSVSFPLLVEALGPSCRDEDSAVDVRCVHLSVDDKMQDVLVQGLSTLHDGKCISRLHGNLASALVLLRPTKRRLEWIELVTRFYQCEDTRGLTSVESETLAANFPAVLSVLIDHETAQSRQTAGVDDALWAPNIQKSALANLSCYSLLVEHKVEHVRAVCAASLHVVAAMLDPSVAEEHVVPLCLAMLDDADSSVVAALLLTMNDVMACLPSSARLQFLSEHLDSSVWSTANLLPVEQARQFARLPQLYPASAHGVILDSLLRLLIHPYYAVREAAAGTVGEVVRSVGAADRTRLAEELVLLGTGTFKERQVFLLCVTAMLEASVDFKEQFQTLVPIVTSMSSDEKVDTIREHASNVLVRLKGSCL